ncbi:carbon storage regulator [Bacillus canaveralius]|uniref:Translational regulator CsrA n=1 Tax=Bacillus canaveralius TaxID=1403243 RepID=A0A2N5GMR0_9BACI|nr:MULTISPECIES: carbon storage regulator CsrA [Bacillus]PLR82580.1 carbon storage regulator [Bacillus sp. V33-4]PLR83161.1 carbon storage regulator [Bacillus canaveralius]PLR94079.1 carbon storage regulator [Bacillus canaveralius]RSK54120.1 carbon storage regulator [Bacillus canaveralius]
MLVLSRKKNESLVIGENIEIKILEINGDQIKIGIKAPKEIDILRKEIVIKTEKENSTALKSNFDINKFL